MDFPRTREQVNKQALLEDTLAFGSCHLVHCLFISSFKPGVDYITSREWLDYIVRAIIYKIPLHNPYPQP